MKNIEVGSPVFAIAKQGEVNNLENSIVWRNSQRGNKPLYVIFIRGDGQVILHNEPDANNETAGDYFILKDLVHWDDCVEVKVCRIINSRFCWLLVVDGQSIPFQSVSSAEYFKRHYTELGYQIFEEKDHE